jgi:hypothetical protein
VVRGEELIKRLHKALGHEWLDKEQWVKIIRATILPPPAPRPVLPGEEKQVT